MKKSIEYDYKFKLPQKIKIVKYDNQLLIISPNTAKWIVLDNEKQLEFYELLNSYSFGDAIGLFQGEMKDVNKVAIEIVAKEFESDAVESCVSKDIKQLHLYVTNACNLRCPHCYMFSGIKTQQELSTDEIKNILSDFKRTGGQSITLSGGEIATRSDIEDIIQFASNLGLRVRLLTNGLLWDEEKINRISSFIESVQISIDGFSEETNAKIRGIGNFDRALSVVERFINSGVKTEIAITPSFDCLGEDYINGFVDFCNYLIGQYPKDLFKIKIAEQLLDGREVHLSEDDKLKYYCFVTNIKSKINGRNSELESFIHSFSKPIIMDNCMYGVFAIDSNGDVFFCSRVSSLSPIANIRNTSFDKIVKMSTKAQLLSRIDNFTPCKDCELKYICGGGCRIDYFPQFAEITDIDNVDFSKFDERKCSTKHKERFYRLMIAANKRLYK